MRTFADWFVTHRPAVGVFLVAVTALATWGHIRPEVIDRPRDTYQRRLRDAETTAGDLVTNQFDLARSDAYLVVEVDNLFCQEATEALRAMVAAVRELPTVDTVLWVDNIPLVNVFGLANPLLPGADASAAAFEQARSQVLQHPLAGRLISPDGQTLLMPLVYDWLAFATRDKPPAATASWLAMAQRQLHVDDDHAVLTLHLLDTARDALDHRLSQLPSTSSVPEIHVRLTGDVPLYVAQRSALDRNQIVFQGIGYFLAFVISVILFRGVASVLVITIAPALGVFWALGLTDLFGFPTNPLADAVLPVLVSMIGLTDGVHLLVHIRRRRMAGDTPQEASRSALERVGLACWLTSLTTSIGFASLLVADSQYVQDFGRVCCLGVLVTFVAVTTFVPFACSTRIGYYIQRGQERDLMAGTISVLHRIIVMVTRQPRRVTALAVIVTLCLGLVCLRLEPDYRFSASLPDKSEAYQALAHCDTVLGGIQFIDVSVRWNSSVPRDDTRLLAAIRDVETMLHDEPLLQHPLSIRNLLATFPGDPNDLATQMTFLWLLPQDLRSFFFRVEDRQAIVVARIQDRGIATYTPVFNRLERRLAEWSAKQSDIELRLEGRPVQISRDLYQIVTDLRTSLGTATITILVVLAVVYRSARVGLVSIIPNLFPLVATGALLVMVGKSLDLSSVCAFVVCLGIAVDDTIHFLSRFRQEMVETTHVSDAIERTIVGVGSALLMTTVILVAGFATLLLSDLPGHRTFAGMACVTISAALLGDLVALPAILKVAWSSQPDNDTGA